MRGRLHIKTTQISPFFCNIPVFQSFLPYISHHPLQIFHTCEKIRGSANHRFIFELSSSQESSSTQSVKVRKRNFATQDWTEAVQQKEESFSRSLNNATLSNWASILSNLAIFWSVVDNCRMRQKSRCLLSLWSLNSQESDPSSIELSSELLLPEVFLKYSHRKRPKLTVIPVMRRGQGCTLRHRPLYNRNNSDGKASLKRQRTPETTTDTKDVYKFYWFNV